MNYEIYKNIFYENIIFLYETAKNSENLLSLKNNYNSQKKYLLEN